MSCSLNSLKIKGGYIKDYVEDYCKGLLGV